MNARDCMEWKELAALRLYGELGGEEETRLAAHLERCADCRALAGELERGLGRLRTPVSAAAPGRARPLLVPLLAFAAGALCALGWSSLSRRHSVPDATASPAAAATEFARDTPPPQARDRGLGAALAAVARR